MTRERDNKSCFLLAVRMALENSMRMVVRRGVHQGLDMGEGRKSGAEVSILMLRRERDVSNH